jgi:sugar/nucleoside kinase (ribokinase family)
MQAAPKSEMEMPIRAAVFGNATLDVICKTVDEVPRYESIAFEDVVVSPGGCGSNVAIGLAAQSVQTLLIARVGQDDAGRLVQSYWRRAGIDLSCLQLDPEKPTAVSVGLVDSQAQPRFIHTPGANGNLTAADLDIDFLLQSRVKWLHIAGFFVLPGILDGLIAEKLKLAQQAGLGISLDVVRSPRMRHPEYVWPCLPYLDVFLCNAEESRMLTGKTNPVEAARDLLQYGGKRVIVKLGQDGCLLAGQEEQEHIPGVPVEVVDTTGAGDAFAAGLIAALIEGADLPAACLAANLAGAQNAACFSALGNWLPSIPR